MARTPGDHDEKRIEVARACFRAIAARGLELTKLQDIADELGCTTGVLGYYFKNKSELLQFTKNYLFDEINRNMMAGARSARGIERLRAMLLEALPLDGNRLVIWQIYLAFLSQAIGKTDLIATQAQRNFYSIELVAREIRGLQKESALPATTSAKEEAIMAVAFTEGLGLHAAIDPARFPAKLQRRLVQNYVQRTFGAALHDGFALPQTPR